MSTSTSNPYEEDPSSLTLLQLYGAQSSTCGYCGASPGTRSVTRSSKTFGVDMLPNAEPFVYQRMIDRGWRRSGTYCYKPDLKGSCCPQYTIKLDVREFTPSRSQRKVLYRFQRFIRAPGPETEAGENANGSGANNAAGGSGEQELGSTTSTSKATQKKKGKGKGKRDTTTTTTTTGISPTGPPEVEQTSSSSTTFPLVDELHAIESGFLKGAGRKWEVTLEPSSFSEEKFQLYCAYQRTIHHDHDKSRGGFERFLCETPLKRTRIRYARTPPAHLPTEYGSYHQMYRLDGELIAMGVIDILPYCVSSVYLMYAPAHETHSLGKLSALKEIALAQEMASYGAPGMGYLYMGFYIHTCPKMKYKAQYGPSFLLDPEEFTWCPMEKALPLLDRYKYVPFHDSAKAIRPMEAISNPPQAANSPPSSLDDNPPMDDDDDEDYVEDGSDDDTKDPSPELSPETLAAIQIGQVKRGTVYVMPAQVSRLWSNEYARGLITRAAGLLGEAVVEKVVMVF